MTLWFMFVLFLWNDDHDPQIVSEYRFHTMSACQEYRAHYIDTHKDSPGEWEITRCIARGQT